MRSLSTSAFGQPSETKEIRGARAGASIMSFIGVRLPRSGSGRNARPPRGSRHHGSRIVFELQFGADRHDAARVQLRMALVIMVLDMLEVDGLGYARLGVEFAQIARQIPVIGDAADVAFEMADKDRIETDQRGDQPPVGLGDALA